ncbi:carboxypeptidase regulatory-like domain-containing protein [Deinococcus sp. Arct2-2]|uniref:carboxypeptidase-like regulatory domain-containing protein n=1 Tax=Deinococcus sp. Arct2-2 TaxID=2568653 RepID=UPI0010A3CD9D|nr:carboxypeptidase-like regulatory domain-containing protein [Deinococcus sp. Arct2-2]THF70898.1 carboxypeptidase regulatory-like domain-containing protein [Deinococcus sp. Arct2-2]
MSQRFLVLTLAALLTVPAAQAAAPTPRTMSGVVLNSAGQPLVGAQVFAGSTLFFNSNSLAVSGQDGRYRAKVPPGSWYGGAQMTRSFQGETYTFDLIPNTVDPFAGSTGAIRNFQWKLTGPKPGGGFAGATVTVYTDFFDPQMLDIVPDIELILTPAGPLIDGSQGKTIRAKIRNTHEGMEGLQDIPLGIYTVTARHVPAGGAPQPLKIRLRNKGEFGPSVTSRFRRNGSAQLMEVEVSRR